MSKNKVEDEVHFLIECNIYGSRNKFLDQVHLKFPGTAGLSNKDKFIFLMTQEDPEMKALLKTVREWQDFRAFLCNHFYQ